MVTRSTPLRRCNLTCSRSVLPWWTRIPTLVRSSSSRIRCTSWTLSGWQIRKMPSKKAKNFSPTFNLPSTAVKVAVLTQTKQNGHWWVPLFTSFSLCHFVLGEPVSTRHPHHPLQHRPSGNGVICTYSVHCHNRGVFVLVGTGLQNVRHALATDFDAECELVEWPTPYDLLRNGPCEQP